MSEEKEKITYRENAFENKNDVINGRAKGDRKYLVATIYGCLRKITNPSKKGVVRTIDRYGDLSWVWATSSIEAFEISWNNLNERFRNKEINSLEGMKVFSAEDFGWFTNGLPYTKSLIVSLNKKIDIYAYSFLEKGEALEKTIDKYGVNEALFKVLDASDFQVVEDNQ